jgi:hypothetical protein
VLNQKCPKCAGGPLYRDVEDDIDACLCCGWRGYPQPLPWTPKAHRGMARPGGIKKRQGG